MLEWLEQYEGIIVLSTLLASIIILCIAELVVPLREDPDTLGFRWVNNIGLALVTLLCSRLFYTFLGASGAWFATRHQFGLFAQVEAPWALAFVVALLAFNLADYWVHRAMHRYPLLWRLHAVHHSDTAFDLTTAYRNHPLESMLFFCARLPIIVSLGIPVSVAVTYEVLRTAQELWSHSNTRLPPRLDRFLRLIVVTPTFHRVHHCSQEQFTNSNFGNTLPWFDYLFGTYRHRPVSEHVEMEMGLEYFREPRDSRLDRMLLMPLRRRSDYRSTFMEPGVRRAKSLGYPSAVD
ncbi:MAG: sterol desaturase family protein [Pseudomonadota bacterium]